MQHDLISERVIIGFLMQHGSNVLADIDCSLDETDFFDTKNQSIYTCLKHIIDTTDTKSVTIDNVFATAQALKLEHAVTKDDLKYLKVCKNQDISPEELPNFVKRVKFWSVVRQLKSRNKSIENNLANLKGNESIIDIIAQTEEALFDFLPSLLREDDMLDLGDFAQGYVEHLASNPVLSPGLPSGFPNWDHCIGGGLRRGTVNVVAARPKVGKSFFCLNVSHNLAVQNIPILYLDTELNKEVQTTRWSALMSGLPSNEIETGQFAENAHQRQQMLTALEQMKQLPFSYVSVAGKSPQQILSTARRWLRKKVGVDENGNTNDCLIILDYIKVMDLKELGNFAEHQYLGDIMTKLHNFAVHNDLPMLAAAQLNRDGIMKDSTDAISSSDRILWLCSSITFLKNKTPEDVAAGDSKANGDKKLIVIDTRFGGGMDVTSEYINIKSQLGISKLSEGSFNYENTQQTIDTMLDEEDEDAIPI
jgi:replicative DNA helicase